MLFEEVSYDPEKDWDLVWKSSNHDREIKFAKRNPYFSTAYIQDNWIGSGTCIFLQTGSAQFCFEEKPEPARPPATIQFRGCEMKFTRTYGYDWNWAYKTANGKNCEYLPNMFLDGREIVFDAKNVVNYPELTRPIYAKIAYDKPYEVRPGIFAFYDISFHASGELESRILARASNLGCDIQAHRSDRVRWRDGDFRFPESISNNSKEPVIVNGKKMNDASIFFDEKDAGTGIYYVYGCEVSQPDTKDKCTLREKLICEGK